MKMNLNDVYSRDNLSKIKDGAYILNLHEYESVETLWIASYVNDNNVTYFDSFEVEHILTGIRKFIANKNVVTNIYRIQAYDSIICEFFCIRFFDFMLKDKILLECTKLFSCNE